MGLHPWEAVLRQTTAHQVAAVLVGVGGPLTPSPVSKPASFLRPEPPGVKFISAGGWSLTEAFFPLHSLKAQATVRNRT